jgi:hypothetical protein
VPLAFGVATRNRNCGGGCCWCGWRVCTDPASCVSVRHWGVAQLRGKRGVQWAPWLVVVVARDRSCDHGCWHVLHKCRPSVACFCTTPGCCPGKREWGVQRAPWVVIVVAVCDCNCCCRRGFDTLCLWVMLGLSGPLVVGGSPLSCWHRGSNRTALLCHGGGCTRSRCRACIGAMLRTSA